MKRVIVGLSGGVDSSVAAYLLKEQGYDVIGIFMKNWTDESVTLNNECAWVDDSADAILVAERLGIPFQTIDFSAEYKSRIIDYMFAEYASGRTPNPDILCNREIKFDVFLNAALQLNADFVATGHYCQKDSKLINGQTVYQLLAGADQNKDQSYFLCQISQEQLSKALFPIGHLQKSEVREIAARENLITANKKDSQGLCFVGKISLPDFLQQKLTPKKGNIVEIPASCSIYTTNHVSELPEVLSLPFVYHQDLGKVIGQHEGAHYYTVGQRKGLNIGGREKPLFIIATDTDTNIIYVGQGKDHPGLHRPALKINTSDVHWIREDLQLKSGEQLEVSVRIRYRQALESARLIQLETGLFIVFDRKQKGITPGQFAAWYVNGELLGSGVISA